MPCLDSSNIIQLNVFTAVHIDMFRHRILYDVCCNLKVNKNEISARKNMSDSLFLSA